MPWVRKSGTNSDLNGIFELSGTRAYTTLHNVVKFLLCYQTLHHKLKTGINPSNTILLAREIVVRDNLFLFGAVGPQF